MTIFYSIIGCIAGLITVIVCLWLLNTVAAACIRTVIGHPTCCVDESLKNKIATWAYGDPMDTPTGQAGAEMTAASTDSDNIEGWVKRCTSLSLSNPRISSKIKAEFGVDGDHYANDASNRLTQEHVIFVSSDLYFLSAMISRARVENAQNAAGAYKNLQIGNWIAVLIGLATTVLVSFSSTEFGKGDGSVARGVRVFAIVFPALGTAVAAITAFYAPREDLARSSQALASIRQIHDQIASDIGQIPCPTEEEAVNGGGEIGQLYPLQTTAI